MTAADGCGSAPHVAPQDVTRGSDRSGHQHKGGRYMWKSAIISAAAVAIAAGSLMLLPLRSHEAAAQSGPYIVNAINLDVAPDQFDKFMEAAKENAAASAKDPGCLQFNILVSQTDPHHLMFFEVYENAAAVDFHRQTEHFKKYQAVTKGMVIKADVARLFSVAMNMHGS